MSEPKLTELEQVISEWAHNDCTEFHDGLITILAGLTESTNGVDLFRGELSYWVGNEVTSSDLFTREALTAALSDVNWDLLADIFLAEFTEKAENKADKWRAEFEMQGPERGDLCDGWDR